MMPEDFGGIPSPSIITTADGKQHPGVRHLLSEPMIRAQHEPTIILLDEFNHAGHDVMGAAQEWINNPPANCWMIACSNPVEQSTAGVELAPPVVNRMCILDWEIPVEAITAGWESGFQSYPDPSFPLVPADYLEIYGKFWGEKLAEFRRQHPDIFDDGFPKDPSEACNPWPSYRSFTNVGMLMAACDAVGANKATRNKLVRGCVGRAAADQWNRFMSEYELPDPETLLADPKSLKLPVRFDRARVVLGMVIDAVEGTTDKRWEQAFDVIEVAFDQCQELAMVAEAKLWSIKPDSYLPKSREGNAKTMRELRLANAQ